MCCLSMLSEKPRVLTLNIIVRKFQIETTRDHFEGEDETKYHTVQNVERMSNLIRNGLPEAKLTWALSWGALTDTSLQYKEVRQKILEMHHRYGDDITFIPGGYFANRYNTREQVNRDISDAFRMIREWTGISPKTIIAGFLSAANIEYARTQEGVIGVQGNIWSQYSVDNMDGDGSIAYPYYPSKQHFCKPAQSEEDFIDCLNFDGWTVDFFNARLVGCRSRRLNSRMGVGPIETLGNLKEMGLEEMKYTTAAHFETSYLFNPFTWITNNIELCLLEQIKFFPLLTEWLRWMKHRWSDVQCPTLQEFAAWIRARFPNNQKLAYELHQRGNGISKSHPKEEIVWVMNLAYRCGIHISKRNKWSLFDYTHYPPDYQEPQGLGQRNWSLLGEINQKGTRKQDRPRKIPSCKIGPNFQTELKELLLSFNMKLN